MGYYFGSILKEGETDLWKYVRESEEFEKMVNYGTEYETKIVLDRKAIEKIVKTHWFKDIVEEVNCYLSFTKHKYAGFGGGEVAVVYHFFVQKDLVDFFVKKDLVDANKGSSGITLKYGIQEETTEKAKMYEYTLHYTPLNINALFVDRELPKDVRQKIHEHITKNEFQA